MKIFRSAILLFLITWFSVATGQGVKFSASAPASVQTGDRFNLVYTLNAEGRNFRGPAMDGFNVLSGPNTSQSSSIQIINGKVARSVEYSFTYVLAAGQEGDFEIPPAQVVVEGTSYESNPVKIKVVKGSSGSQGQPGTSQGKSSSGSYGDLKNDVFIRAVANKTSPMLGEQIIVTYKLYFRINISAPEFRKEPSFMGFWKTDLNKDRQSYVQYTETYNGQQYNVAEIKKYALFPQKSGKIEIEAANAVCQGQVREQGQRNRDPFFDSFFNDPFFNRYKTVEIPLIANAVSIHVNTLPTANRPADFSGAVGSFEFISSIDKTSLKANEAINLRFTVRGKGNIELVDKLPISFPPDFEVYDPKISSDINVSEDGVSGSKTFEYLIIPRTQGTFTIKPVTFSFFDLKQQFYKTILSPEYTINVSKGEGSAGNVTYSGVNQADIKYIGSDIRHIKTRGLNLVPAGSYFFGSSLFYVLFLAPIVLFILFVFTMKKELKKRSNIALMRNRKATKVAQKRMKKAHVFLKENNKDQFFEEVSQALWGYLSDKFSIPLSNLSMDTVRDALLVKEVNEVTINQFIETLDHCEYARFAPGENNSEMDKVYNEGIKIISQIENELK
ncbi:MAG: protein BatD [Bacteroidetes bacterium]|nr:protein BatD [Bacteroidota bacterium]